MAANFKVFLILCLIGACHGTPCQSQLSHVFGRQQHNIGGVSDCNCHGLTSVGLQESTGAYAGASAQSSSGIQGGYYGGLSSGGFEGFGGQANSDTNSLSASAPSSGNGGNAAAASAAASASSSTQTTRRKRSVTTPNLLGEVLQIPEFAISKARGIVGTVLPAGIGNVASLPLNVAQSALNEVALI